jgi:hypothetical protein
MSKSIYIEPESSERDYRKLIELSVKLGVPVPQVFLEMEVTMPDGRILTHFKQRSHSWVRNAYNLMFTELAAVDGNDGAFGAGKLNIKDTSAALYVGNRAEGQLNADSMLNADKGYTCGAGLVTNGIVLGSDATVESFEDFALLAPILNGVGAGELAYAASLPYAIAYDIPSKTLSAALVRFMNNNSGGDVLIKELALVNTGVAGGAGGVHWLNSRDHLGATVTVPNTGQLKVTYTVNLVYPA